MHGIAALLGAAAVAFIVSRLLRMAAVPFLLLAGVGLSATGAVPAPMLENSLILGVSFLLFLAGLDLDPRRVRAQRDAALAVGTIQFVVLGALGYAAARVLGFGVVESGYVALVLTASSTLIGVRLLQNRQQMFEPFGRLVIGVLLLQDVLVLLLLPLVTELTAGWADAARMVAGIGLLGALAWVVRSWISPVFLDWSDEVELKVLGSLALLFIFLGVAGALGIPLVAGAFLAGAGLARFPVHGIVRAELAPVGDFFTAIFFTALGALIRLPTGPEVVQALVLILIVIVVTPPLVAVIAVRAGFTTKSGLEAGLFLAQTSEISLVVGLTGRITGVIGESLFVVIALVTLTTMLLTPFLSTDEMASRLAHWWPGSGAGWRSRRRRGEGAGTGRGDAGTPADHVLILGAGSTGMPLIEDLVQAGSAVAVIDDDPAVVARLRDAGVRALRGEATDSDVLERAGAERARVVISTIRRPRGNAVLLERIGGRVPVLVRVFDSADAAWVEAMGGRPMLYSSATADELVEWYENAAGELDASLAERVG